MSADWCLCHVLFPGDINWPMVACAVVVQVAFGLFYYTFAVNAPWTRYVAIDKGVKNITMIRQNYSMLTCTLSTWVHALLRTLAVLGLATVTKASNCAQWQQVGFFVACTIVCGHECNLWSQRPMPLIVIEAVGVFATCSLAAGYLSWSL